MRRAHVVLTALAVQAFPARHDLLGDHPITDVDSPSLRCCVVEFDDAPNEFVSGDHHRLRPGRTVLVTPELGRPVITLEVAGADADRLDPDQRLTGTRPRDRDLLEPIVLRAVAHHGLHLLRNLFGHSSSSSARPAQPAASSSWVRHKPRLVWLESH